MALQNHSESVVQQIEHCLNAFLNKYSFWMEWLLLLACLLHSTYWFFSMQEPLLTAEPYRIFIGSIVVFFVPGYVLCKILGVDNNHIMEICAISFSFSIIVEVLLIAIVFFLQGTINMWVTGVLCFSYLGIVVLITKNLKKVPKPEMQNLYFKNRSIVISQLTMAVCLILISCGAYKWGEAIADISGEKLLHLFWIRQYYSLPITPDLFLSKPLNAVPNLVQLWEFLIAGWAKLISVDPLYVFFHARFIIPIIGFSSLHFMVKMIFRSRIKVEVIFWIMLIICVGNIGLHSPSPLDWVRADAFRGVMSFMGTAHHSDAAMDILIPLLFAWTLYFLRASNIQNLLILMMIFVVSFMWHPREVFQNMVYIGVGAILVVSYQYKHFPKSTIKWVAVFSCILCILVFFLSINVFFYPKHSGGYDEWTIKRAAFTSALYSENLLGFTQLFEYPLHLELANPSDATSVMSRDDTVKYFQNNSRKQYYVWSILSAFGAILLLCFGDRRERLWALYYMMFWELVFCWKFSMFLIIGLTYSEIFLTMPRMIYILSYLTIAASFWRGISLFKVNSMRDNIAFFVGTIIAGISFRIWWMNGKIGMDFISMTLSIMLPLFMIYGLLQIKKTKLFFPSTVSAHRILIGSIIFFAIVLYDNFEQRVHQIFFETRPSVAFHSEHNPFDFSVEAINSFRNVPIGHILTDPLGKACFFVYSAHYPVVVPRIITSVISQREIYDIAEKDLNPLFNKATSAKGPLLTDNEKLHAVNHYDVMRYLRQNKADYVFVQKKHYEVLISYFQQFEANYKILFDNPHSGEFLVLIEK